MTLTWTVQQEVRSVATEFKLTPAALLAVVEVESAGQAYATFDGRTEPVIRWEGHYFYRLLKGAAREKAVRAGLAHPRAGAVKNPRSQKARYALLAQAMKINEAAAISSCSWGVGQVMGSHWKKLGYRSPKDLMNSARLSVAGQVRLMVRYIRTFGLADELARRDWSGFARGYNGPAYRKYRYHTKMAEAYRRYADKDEPAVPASSTMLRLGSQGARVRELQLLLRRAGHTVTADGDFGPATKDAVMAFQREARITIDGVAGPNTLLALKTFQVSPDEVVDAVPERRQTEAIEQTAKGGGLVAAITVLRDTIAETAMNLFGVENATAQTIANGAMAVSGGLAAGLAVYGVWRWWRSRQTYEGLA